MCCCRRRGTTSGADTSDIGCPTWKQSTTDTFIGLGLRGESATDRTSLRLEQGNHALNLVWFKRDLRVQDHEPLAQAAARGPIIPLYILEPELWQQPDASQRQWQFVRDSLVSLARSLEQLGQRLWIIQGEATQVLASLVERHAIQQVYAHMETGNGWTYQRDLSVHRRLRALGVPFMSIVSTGLSVVWNYAKVGPVNGRL